MRPRHARKPRPPLGRATLDELALAYVGRFATTRARLVQYLKRKVGDRGWDGDAPADFDAIAGRLVGLGYIDDAAYALAKSRALTGRGYGAARVRQSLRVAGVGDDDGAGARDHAVARAAEAALDFARRRRFGPYAAEPADPKARDKALAAMIRAGHGFRLARAIIDAAPGTEMTAEQLDGIG